MGNRTPSRRCGESGQAITELVVMLVALLAVILGTIFVGALSMTDNDVLLTAKRNAERSARILNGEPILADGREITRWEYGSVRFPDRTKAVIPFSALDRMQSTEISSIRSGAWQFGTELYSESDGRYLYEWKSPAEFDRDAMPDDFTATLDNARAAAALVVGRAASDDAGDHFYRGYRDNASAAMRSAFYTWFGIKISDSALRRSPSNAVYMPRGGTSDP